jgi:hypothetical protein
MAFNRIYLSAAALAVAMLAVSDQAVRGQVPDVPLRMQAFAVNMTNVATGANGILEITIDRWSTAQEREELITTMVEKGQDALLDRLKRVPVKGKVRIPGWKGPDPNNYRIGWDLRYTFRDPLPDGGQRFVIATDRYMTMWELRNRPRTVDYPFTLIEIRFPKEGRGEGRMAVANQINFDKKKNVIELEQYSAGTVRLNDISIEKK